MSQFRCSEATTCDLGSLSCGGNGKLYQAMSTIFGTAADVGRRRVMTQIPKDEGRAGKAL
jgi:hypothetical protein